MTTSALAPGAIPREGHVVIEASAGTGKTYTLENLVTQLVTEGGIPLPEILVVTFTEKATAELQTRIRARLRSVVPGQDGAPDPWREAKDAALAAFDSASIMTIHGFCHRILKQESFAMGRPFLGVQVASRPAFRRALRESLRGPLATIEPAKSFLREALSNGMRLESLENLLLAAHRFDRLLPEVDVASMAVEARRLAPLLSPPAGLETAFRAAKVHHATAKKLAAELESLARAFAEFTARGDLPRLLLAAERAFDRGYMEEKLGPIATADPEVVRLRGAALSALTLLPPFAAALAQLFLPVVRSQLSAWKLEQGAYDFDDMLRIVADRVEAEAGESLVARLRARYRVALIDEFQDTDDVQWRLFRKIFFDAGGDHRLILVGDPKQAIYGFRGADVFTYLRAKEEVESHRGAFASLDANYRSTRELIAGYNEILGAGSSSPLLSGAIKYDRPVACGLPELSLVSSAGSVADRIAAPAVVVFEQENAPADERSARLLSAIAEEIAFLLGPSPLLFSDGATASPIQAGDIFVLARSHGECARVREALGRRGIPCELGRQAGLFQSEEASSVRDLLLALEAPEDRARRSAVLLSPYFDLTIEEVALHAEGGSSAASALLERWGERAHERRWPELFEQILEESGILRRAIVQGNHDSSGKNHRHILEFLAARGSVGRLPLRELLLLLEGLMEDRLEAEQEEQERQTVRGDAVLVMTTHASKGLEAKVVFLFGGVEAAPQRGGVRPFHDSSGRRVAWVGDPTAAVKELVSKEAREEEERLSYVALTRAKGRLYLPYFFDHGKAGVTPARLAGPYARIHSRLALIQQSGVWPAAWGTVAVPSLTPTVKLGVTEEVLARWSPPASLLVEPAPLSVPYLVRFETSYTRLRNVSEESPVEVAQPFSQPLDQALVQAGESKRAVLSPGHDGPIARGLEAGIHLHSLLEGASVELIAKHETFEAWWAEVHKAPFADCAARLGTLPETATVAKAAGEMVYRAYTTPIPLRQDTAPLRLAHAERIAREITFSFVPGAGASGPPADEIDYLASLQTTHGFVRGVIDALVEHAGRLWVVEWKSDALLDYSPRALTAHVQSRYPLQAQIYALALAKDLGISDESSFEVRVGGVVFVFIRGLGVGGTEGAFDGACCVSPSWASLATLESDLSRGRGRLS